jgi:hypothetical protein
MVRIAFDPGEKGFSFGNAWEFDDVERQQLRDAVEVRLNRLRDRGGAVFGGMARYIARRAIRPIRERLEEGLEQGYGLCGGMSFAALDFFLAGIPVPWLSEAGAQPASGSRLRGYLWKRQLQSFVKDLDRFLYWMAQLHYVPSWWPFNGGPTWLVAASKKEWAKLKRSIDDGKPIPLGLVRNSISVFDNHQVLALGYEEGDEGTGIIYVYDPNCPGQESAIRVRFAGKVLEAEETCRGTRDLRGFFCEEYEYVDPREALA